MSLGLEYLSDEAKSLYDLMTPNFEKRISAMLKIPVAVLIWGPSPTSPDGIGNVRLMLREELRKQGHLAMFSEELCDFSSIVSIRTQQLIQAEEYDLIISIPTTPGAIAEIHDFTADTRINNKIVVFLERRFMNGYSNQSLEALSNALSFDIIEYDDSSIIISECFSIVHKIREYKFLTAGRK